VHVRLNAPPRPSWGAGARAGPRTGPLQPLQGLVLHDLTHLHLYGQPPDGVVIAIDVSLFAHLADAVGGGEGIGGGAGGAQRGWVVEESPQGRAW
jgi:hypothetical protein